MYQFNRKEYEERMKWYQDARFGMFIHWGLYSIPARGEWVRSTDGKPDTGDYAGRGKGSRYEICGSDCKTP